MEQKIAYGSYTGTYWVYCTEAEEYIEITEDELIEEKV